MADTVLLAPVPARHLQDVLAVCETEGEVAFGSNDWQTLQGVASGVPTYIYASHTDSDVRGIRYQPGLIHIRGLFVRWEESRAGKCREPEKRPSTALDGDSDWRLFWYVSDLEQLVPPKHLSQFGWKRTGLNKDVPMGPVAASIKSRE